MVLEKANLEERDEYTEAESDRQDKKERNHIFKLEVWPSHLKKEKIRIRIKVSQCNI